MIYKEAYEVGAALALAEYASHEMDKQAFIGSVASAGSALGRGLWGAGKMGWGGVKGVYGAAKVPFKPFDLLGKGVGNEMLSFGTFGAGLGAATADPGERLQGALHGFVGGAIGGAGWGVGRNATKKLIGGAFKNSPKGSFRGMMGEYANNPKAQGIKELYLDNTISPRQFAKHMGVKTTGGLLGLGAAFTGSSMAEDKFTNPVMEKITGARPNVFKRFSH